MGYTAHELAELSGVSVRTLHYYEEQGLLHPARRANGYRDYGAQDVRTLQRILLFRQAQMPLASIAPLLDQPESAIALALRSQLGRLKQQREGLDALIETVLEMVREAEAPAKPTAKAARRDERAQDPEDDETTTHLEEKTMSKKNVCAGKDGRDAGDAVGNAGKDAARDAARFAAFKMQAIAENEQRYGAEVRERWGNEAADASNARVAGLSESEWNMADELQEHIGELVRRIGESECPEQEILGDAGRELCETHRRWLMHYWTPEMYSPEAHRCLAQGYVADPRFAEFYDAMGKNGAQTVRDAIETWA